MPDEPRDLAICPICRITDTRLELAPARDPAPGLPLVRCRGCGLVFQQLVRSFEELEAAQGEAYGKPRRRFNRLVELLVRLARRARVRLTTRLLPEGGRVLDIGCGRGVYLRMLQERGYRVRGTELSAATAAHVDPGIPVDLGDVEPGAFAESSFDLISIWHVLEHLQRPDRTLAACAEALVPGGALLIAVPNYDSPEARFGGEHWFHLDLPRHVFQFTTATLRRLLTNAGLRIEQRRTGQWEMDAFSWLQTALNRLGLRHNALYDTLSSNPRVRRDLSPVQRAAMLGLLVLGLPIAVVVSWLMRISNRAGTMVVLARKPVRSEGDPEGAAEGETEHE